MFTRSFVIYFLFLSMLCLGHLTGGLSFFLYFFSFFTFLNKINTSIRITFHLITESTPYVLCCTCLTEKCRRRLFANVRDVCAALSSQALPHLKNKVSERESRKMHVTLSLFLSHTIFLVILDYLSFHVAASSLFFSIP